jgi:maleate cis-trans isomerase
MIRHFGVLIPSTNITVEMEYNRLLPPTALVPFRVTQPSFYI